MALDRITVNPEQMNGQPCIRRMRITIRRVLEALAVYPDRNKASPPQAAGYSPVFVFESFSPQAAGNCTRKRLKREYPEIEDEDIKQALEYAASLGL